MELLDAIAKRRSVRTYKKQDLPLGTVEKLLETARLAPSAGNVQPWAFIVASTQKTKTDLSQAAFGQRNLQEAPLCLLFVRMRNVLQKATADAAKHSIVSKTRQQLSKTSY